MKKFLTLTLTAILCCLLTGIAQAQSYKDSTVNYTGSGKCDIPSGAWKIVTIKAWGGGGGGGNATNKTGCGGGGGGAYATNATEIYITPVSTLNYNVGAGGSGGSAGGNSYVTASNENNAYVNAGGGKSPSNNTNAGANGGTVIKGTGYGGGKGGNGTQSSGFRSASGGGGGGAGTSGAGNTGNNASSGSSAGNGGAAKTDGGGAGGNGVTYNTNGNSGNTYGGGGSGAAGSSLSTRTGGKGANGRVTITYEILTLTVSLDLNYIGAPEAETFDVLYYNTYGDNLTTPSRGEGYIFLGWFTDATGGTQVTAEDQCTSTSNVTLYAHWAYAGAITTITETTDPCGDYSVTEDTAAVGDVVYSWEYSFNNGNWQAVPNATSATLNQGDMTLNQMGTYQFHRYITANSQTVISGGTYSVHVRGLNTPGAITSGSQHACTTASVTIANVTEAEPEFSTSTVTYIWKYSKDGGEETTIDNSNSASYTAQNLAAGTYVFKRYVTIADCAVPVVSAGEDTVVVVDLSNYNPTISANYTQLCEGGKLVIGSDNFELDNIDQDYIYPTFKWLTSDDGINFSQVPDMHGDTMRLNIYYDGNYNFYLNLTYFGLPECVISTDTTDITVVDAPTIEAPIFGTTEPICPNSDITMEAGTIQGGVGSYTYTWEFLPAGGDVDNDWVDTAASQATYSSNTTGNEITAGNFLVTGDVKYRTRISNAQGCEATSGPTTLSIIELPIPIVSDYAPICPAPNSVDTAFTTMVTTTDPSYELYWYADATSTDTIEAPTASLADEDVFTYYVAQFNPDNGCLGARVPVMLTITYTAHLSLENDVLDLNQDVCQNSAMVAVSFKHSGDCTPQVTFDPHQPAGVTVTNANGFTTIAGNPTETGTFTYHVALLPNDTTVCAAPNFFDGSIQVNPKYAVTDNQTICGGSYTISDQMGNSYSFSESGSYTRTLQTVTGCDSVVTLNLYVHEWNQFGFEENESLIAGWTTFSSVSSPISADVAGSVSGSQITYSGWNGSNRADDNLSSSSSLISGSGSSLGLINGTYTTSLLGGTLNMNNGKNILVKTSTSGYGNVKLKFDYGVDRTHFQVGLVDTWSSNDHGFTTVQISYSVDGTHYTDLPILSIELLEQERTYGSYEVNLSAQSSFAIENADNVFLKFVFSGAKKSEAVGLSAYTNYFLIDNLCISGTQLNELELDGETEACTNQSLTLVATPPYTNTNVNPHVTTPIVYKWERIVGGTSTVLDETSNVLVDNEVQAGDYQYKVSVGSDPCGQSATLNVHGIVPAYRLDLVRHGYVCSNEIDHVSNITFTDDCQYVDGMFIVTPTAEEMRTPGTHTCQLSIPTTENQCDSVITLILDVLKAFDTTVVAHICLGETYNMYGFDITPTEEGITYYTSDPTWKCSTGCDSIYRLTLITSSVRQTLVDEDDVILAAWPMDNGITNYVPACGAKTEGSSFMVEGASNVPPFATVTGKAPSSDYCYSGSSNNGALRWPNLASGCSGYRISASYDDFSGAYFEIKLNPYDYENLRLMFDYKRENASTNNAQAFNQVRYSYKFNETDNYNTIGTANITSTNWASQTLNFSTANTLDHEVVYLKVEFIGGNPGSTQSCGTFSGSKYLPSYITVDNVMILGDRPVRAQLDGYAQYCNETYVCEGNDVTFTCQGDDNYFKFYVVDETANDTTAFEGSTTLTKTPTQSSIYKIVAVEQTTMCDSVWGPFNVEVVKNPTITITQGELNMGICGHDTVNNELLIANATSYNFTWLTDHEGLTDTKTTGNQVDTIKITGRMSEGGFAGYRIVANPDSRCSQANVRKDGSITVRRVPTFQQTIGKDTVCEGADMQFVVDTTGCNFFQINEEDRIMWYTKDVVLGNKDTLNYVAQEDIHSARHYISVNQNGCTTVDSMDIVVYKFEADTLRLNESHYVLNYGENFILIDSVKKPDLMHKGEVVAETNIDTIFIFGATGNKIPVNSITDLSATILWIVVDVCGEVHFKEQTLTFEFPPCGDEHHFNVTDVDGNVYHTVRMGWNCWMRENLKTQNYADGTPVAKAMVYVSNEFPNTENTANTFGRLYSWYSCMGIAEGSNTMPTTNEFGHVQGVCPEGWFMPAPEQYLTMEGIDMNELRAREYWLDGGGNNSTNFSILPGGAYNSDRARFENILGNAYFWSADLTGSAQPRTFMADCNCYMWQILDSSPNHAFSVRCVKEKIKNE